MRALASWFGFFVVTTALAENFPPDWADIRLQGRHIVAKPGVGHTVSEQKIEIVESEGCSHKTIGGTQVELLGSCAYLSGVYRYLYQPKTDQAPHHVAVGFTLSMPHADSKVFLVSTPWDLRARSR